MSEEYEHDDPKPFLQLVLETDAGLGITSLKLSGREAPHEEKSPSIGYYKNDKNKFVLKIGNGEHEFELNELPDELGAFFIGKSKTGIAGPQDVPMPGKVQLRRLSDGTYMNYETYSLNVAMNAPSKEKEQDLVRHMPKKVWTRMPRQLYEWLISMYKKQDSSVYGPPRS